MKRNGNNRAMVVSKTQIPEGWRLVHLGDVAEANRSGWSPSDDATILYLDLTSIVVPGIMSCPKKLAAAEAPSRARRRVHSGDILVSTVRPNLRGFARVREAPKNLIASTGFAVLTPMSDVDGSYVYHHVMTQQFAGYLEKATTGQAYPAVRPADVTNFVLPIPPLREQRAIAAVLDSIDDAIEGAEAVIAATGQLRDSLLHELLTRGVPGWHTEWKEAPGLGTIPAGWEVVRLGEVAEVQTGKAVNRKSSRDDDIAVPYLSVANVKDGYLDLGEVKTLQVSKNEIARYSLKAGDVLFTEGGDADKLGRGTVWKEEIPLCLHQNHIFAARPHSGVLKADFLAFFAASLFGKNYFLGAAKQTTNLASVNSTQLREMPVPLPPLREQEAIARLLEGVDLAIERGGDETAVLKLLKESAAAVLLTGRVRLHSSLDCNGSRRIPNLPKEESL